MVNGRFEGASPADSVDQQLQQRAEETQRCLPQSFQRQLALNRLVNEILKSGRIGHPQRNLWPSGLYEDLYNEALQRTLLEVCQKIDGYNPDYPVMAWVNFRLNYQLINVVNDYRKQGMTQVPKSGGTEQITSLPSLDDLNISAPAEDTFSNDRLLRQFLEEDPENFLRKQHLRNRPEVTFQLLVLAKFVEGKTWTELAVDLEVSVQTLCSFFNRQLKELMPYFRKHLRE
jgi:hypothetical protein